MKVLPAPTQSYLFCLLTLALAWYSTDLSLEARSAPLTCLMWDMSLNFCEPQCSCQNAVFVKIKIDIVCEGYLFTHYVIITYN